MPALCSGAIRIVVIKRTRCVTPAAAARVISDSKLGYTRRSRVPRLEKGPPSARLAQSKISFPCTPGMVPGRPIPICIHTSMTRRVFFCNSSGAWFLAPPATRSVLREQSSKTLSGYPPAFRRWEERKAARASKLFPLRGAIFSRNGENCCLISGHRVMSRVTWPFETARQA